MEFCKQKRKRSPRVSQAKKSQWFTVQGSSPPKQKEEKFILELKPFSTFPYITFDKVRIGESKVHTLSIRNPLDVPQSVCIEKFPSEKGFSIDEVRFHILPSEQIEVQITWKPDKAISCRETVLFKSSTGSRTQVYLHGSACSPKKQKRKKWDDKCIDLKSSVGSIEKETKSCSIQEKENINLLNSKIEDLGSNSEKTNFFLPARSIDFPDSPLRRQTYTINSMFQPSHIGADVKDSTFCSVLNESEDAIKKDKIQSNLEYKDSLAPQLHSFSHKEQHISSAFHPGKSHKEILNDSLESTTSEIASEVNSNDLNTQTQGFTNCTYVNNSMTDIKVFDLSSKLTYFGYMPNPGNKTEVQNFLPVHIDANHLERDVSKPFHLNFLNPYNDDLSYAGKKNCIEIKNPTHTALKQWSSESCKTIQEADENGSLKIQTQQLSPLPFSVKSLIHDIGGIPQSSNAIDPISVTDTCSSLAFEIACNNSLAGKNVSPLKQGNTFKRKTQIVSKKKLQSVELLKKKLLSTPSVSVKDNKAKVKVTNGRTDKTERKPSRFLPKRLTLTKIKAADRVYQRNPFATLNAYYDQFWIEKQEMAFTNWLNFILTPNDDFRSSEEVQVNSAEIWVESMKDAAPMSVPSKEDLSFKTYTAAKQLNRLRKSACLLYQSEELAKTIKRIEKEVDLKKICIRSDRATHADLGIKKDLLEMLLSYNPLWLRIGLETVYGEMLALQNNRDVVGLSRFIIHRFLSNPDLVAKYAHSSVINYFKQGFEENMKCFTVKKFLLLVYFLDVAKRVYLIDHNPCLFCKTSKYKSSRDLLITFSRDYLSGEGDITKHLRYLGYIVKHEQTPIEEFDYAVKNIAVDLRCGLRLGRVVELLLQDWTISKSLRPNTLNRLTKIYNNDVILKTLQKAEIDIEGNIDARDIVDGNREKTLNLLWQIIFKTQVSKKVDLETLKKENSYLRRSLKLKADFAAFDALQMYHDKAECFELDFLNSKLFKENEVIQQLFQWCQNVCAHYGVKVYNFTSSFSDGRALCFLLHHYHPNLLPSNVIKKDTTNSYFEEQMEQLEDENCPFLPENRQMKSKAMEGLLKNEKENLDLVFQKAQEIGHIPILSFPSHLSNTLPDEKVIITLVSYINIRLMELSVEIRAARTILLAYRKWRLRKKLKQLKLQIAAAVAIQRYWRKHVENKMKKVKEEAAATIQRIWKVYSAKKQLKALKQAKCQKYLNQKAIVIQAVFKGYRTRRHLQQCQKSAVVIQSCVRKWLARTRFLKLKQVVVKIQSNYRAKISGHFHRQRFLHLKRVVILLQAYHRGIQLRKRIEAQISATVVLQSYVKMWLARKYYLKLKDSCTFIQQKFRSLLLVKEQVKYFQNLRRSVIIIQRWYLCIRKKRLEHESAVKIQTWVRKCLHRKKYLQLRSSIIAIQLWWKGVFITQKTRYSFLMDRKRVILLQAHIRQLIALKSYKKKKMSAVTIQKNVRKIIQHKKFCVLKSNAVLIQRWWRNILLCRRVRNEYVVYQNSVIKIQSFWRMYCSQKAYFKLKSVVSVIERYRIDKKQRIAYLSLKENTVKLQSLFRGYYCRKQFHSQKKAAITIQRFFRSYMIRQRFLKQKSSAIKIQQYFRSYLCMCKDRRKYTIIKAGFTRFQAVYRGIKVRKHINCINEKARIIQTFYRKWVARNNFLKLRRACLVVQQKWRAQVQMKTQVLEYRTFRRSVILIQATMRSRKDRKRFLLQKKAAIKIQSYVRMSNAHESYRRTREKVILIQQYYRSKCLRNAQVNIYSETRKSIIFLQSKVRCFIARRKFLKMRIACILVQSVVRMWLLKTKYSKLHQATLVIQRRFRSLQIAREAKLKYLAMKIATIRIQSFYRMVKQFEKFRRARTSAIFIQRKFRAHLTARKERDNFLLQKKSCVKIQSCIRMVIARKKFLKIRCACITVQSCCRMYLSRKKYLKIRKSVCTLQKHFIAWKITKERHQQYMQMKYSAVLIQSSFRGYAARREFKLKQKACITIQAYTRRFICRKRFLTEKNAAEVLQKHFKAVIIGRQIRRLYAKDRNCIITTQALVRGWLIRKHVQKLHCSAIKIQKTYKSFICRKRFLEKKKSVCILQKHFVAWKIAKECHQQYMQMKHSAIIIQSSFRGYAARKEFKLRQKACITIQAYTRRFICRKRFLTEKNAAEVLQKHFKAVIIGRQIRRLYAKDRNCVITTQALVRGWLIRKHVQKLHCSAIKIQKTYKSFICRKRFLEKKISVCILQKHFVAWKIAKECHQQYMQMKHSAIIIQSSFRGYAARKEFKLKQKASITIQAYTRRFICRKRFLTRKNAAKVLQKHFKAVMIGRQIRRLYAKDRNCIITTQALVRGWLVRKHIQKLNCNAIKIQKTYKSFIYRKRFLKRKKSAIILQKCFKSYMLRKGVHLLYLKLQYSATVIQSAWRGFITRCEFKRKIKSAILLQSLARKMLFRRKFLAMRHSVVLIQHYYLAYKIGMKEYHLYHVKRKSCIKIQAAWRGFLIRRKMEKQKNAAVLIQQCFRLWRQKRRELESLHVISHQQRQWYVHLRSSIIAFQRHSRQYLQRREQSAVLIQSYFRMWLVRRQYRKFKATIKIQALWRGYLIRKNITDPKILTSRQNIRNAPVDEHKSLKNRTTRALETLLTDENLTRILTSLQNLDVCTKLSPICCERLEQSKGLSVLVQLVRSCNRSVPHKEVIKFAANILLNLAKYKKTVNSVWADPNVLSMILDLMKIFREKGVDIFTKCCTLFYIFCQDSEKLEVLKRNSIFCNQIKSFHYLLMRRLSIEEKRSKSSSTSTHASFLRRFHNLNSKESLNIDPDWLLGQHRRREFKDPFTAVASLMHALDLQGKSS